MHTQPRNRPPALPALCRVIAETGVQFISCGALTHSVMALDISLNIETQ
jgi:nicotinate-nucleotide pyrophosphorylase